MDRYSKEVAAAKAGVSTLTLFRWVKAGRFPAADLREGRQHFWSAKLFARGVKALAKERRAVLAARRALLEAQLAKLDGELTP
jgi:predicted site-specific integrase-resolvase